MRKSLPPLFWRQFEGATSLPAPYYKERSLSLKLGSASYDSSGFLLR